MTYQVPRAVVEAFYDAYNVRDAERIGRFVADDIEWNVYGPPEVMQVCGQWRGKAAVVDRFARVIPKFIVVSRTDIECLLVDGDRSSVFGIVTSEHRASGRTISHRAAHFAVWRDDKIVSFKVINDSLDAVEQFIGHRIDLAPGIAPESGDLVAV